MHSVKINVLIQDLGLDKQYTDQTLYFRKYLHIYNLFAKEKKKKKHWI